MMMKAEREEEREEKEMVEIDRQRRRQAAEERARVLEKAKLEVIATFLSYTPLHILYEVDGASDGCWCLK
jgi:hypothetical protein